MRQLHRLLALRPAQPTQPGRPMRGLRLLGLLTAVTLAAVALLPTLPLSRAQESGLTEEDLLLPPVISERDIELRGRYARQWRQPDGTLVVMFNGAFRLNFGQRQLSAGNAVVWIYPRVLEPEGRKYYELVAYLSEEAEVREPAGTTISDRVLLVSNLRTFGQIIKYHDAHAPEVMEQSPLYQEALRDRALIESAQPTTQPAPPTAEPQITRPGEAAKAPELRVPRTVRYLLPQIEPAQTEQGEPIYVATGRVYFSQSGGPDAAVLEIQADNAVVFVGAGLTRDLLDQASAPVSTQPASAAASRGAGDESTPRRSRGSPPAQPTSAPAAERPARPERTPPSIAGPLPTGDIRERIRAVYLEGDVVLSLGERFVRAGRLYYDFERDKALILDAVLRSDVPERGVPLYVRADAIRQLSAREFTAQHARVSTSEFYTPHYHVGAEKVVLRDLTERDAQGRQTARLAGTYELSNATLNVENTPILWWPYSQGELEQSETAMRRFRIGYSGEFGTEIETAWHLFNLLGLQKPPGYDATLRLDYLTDRGPAVGVNSDYERQDQYGLFRSYYIHDDGEDNLGPLRKSENVPDTDERGRILWRHRHYLPNNWEATLELSYLSDPNFLETYEESEFNEGKEQESLLHLKRAIGTEAISLLANWRLLDFVTQTEHLPDLTYRRIGDTFLDPLVLYHESRVGAVRYRPDDRRLFDERDFDNTGLTDVTFRTEGRQEAEWPVKLGPLNFVPFATLRGGFWDGSPVREGGLWRGLGVYGARGGTAFSRSYDDIYSELFDVHRIRHIIRPEFAAWWSHSNARSELLTPFDEGVETIDDFYGALFALRQTWQTKRGAAGETVDLLTFDLEAGFFGDQQPAEFSNGYANPIRPEDSRTRNYIGGEAIYRLSDTTSVLYDFNIDVNDWTFDRHDLSVAIERLPRTAYVFGVRHAGDINMNLVGGGLNYRLNEKHIVASRVWFDIDTGSLGEVAVGYVRKLPRWYFGMNFEYDQVDDDFSVSVSLWPEGIPEWTLGSRRFTGLSTTTGIRP